MLEESHPPTACACACRRWIKRGKPRSKKTRNEEEEEEEEEDDDDEKKETRKKRKGIGWKVQPGFLEGNALVNGVLAHKSSTVNRKTG